MTKEMLFLCEEYKDWCKKNDLIYNGLIDENSCQYYGCLDPNSQTYQYVEFNGSLQPYNELDVTIDPLNKIMSNVSPSQFSKVLTSYSKKMSGIDIGNTVVKGMPSKKALEKVARFQMVTDYKASMKAAGLEKDYIKAKPLIEEFKKAFKLIGKKG